MKPWMSVIFYCMVMLEIHHKCHFRFCPKHLLFVAQVDATSAMAASERIVVFDRKTGKIVTGPVAPTPSTLESWLSRHASFEVLRPGSQVTHNTKSFYGTSGNSMFYLMFNSQSLDNFTVIA